MGSKSSKETIQGLESNLDIFSEQEAKLIITHFDKAHDGRLSKNEFKHFLDKWRKYKAQQVDLDAIFDSFDVDHDGYVTLQELTKSAEPRYTESFEEAVPDWESLASTDTVLEVKEDTKLTLGLAWDFFDGMGAVDLDVAAVAYDNIGHIIDAVYFNKISACNGGLRHSGDCKDGTTSDEKDDETITIDFSKLDSVSVIMFVASVYSGGTFINVETAHCNINVTNPSADFKHHLGHLGDKTSVVLTALFPEITESGTHWVLRDINRGTEGRNFQDCKAVMQHYVDAVVGHEMKLERAVMTLDGKTFNMHKGDCVNLDSSISQLQIGLGWTDAVDDCLDLDASVVLVKPDKKKQYARFVYFSHKTEPGVRHNGDNTTGQGDGDDEVIDIDLRMINISVTHLWIVVNVYAGGTFHDVKDSYMRLFVGNHTLSRFELTKGLGNAQGVIFGVLSRKSTNPNQWSFEAHGTPCNGRTAMDIRCSHWS